MAIPLTWPAKILSVTLIKPCRMYLTPHFGVCIIIMLFQQMAPEKPDFVTLFPTKWTVWVASLRNIRHNYQTIQCSLENCSDMEMPAAQCAPTGIATKFQWFDFFFFGVVLGEKVSGV